MTLTEEQRRSFYNSMDWRNKREAIKARDHYECAQCRREGKVALDIYEPNKNGRKKIKLVVHHIKELEYNPELALEDDNLETLCVECHNKIHDRHFSSRPSQKILKWDDETW